MAATKKLSTTRATKRKPPTKRKAAAAASEDRPAKRTRNSIVDRDLLDKVVRQAVKDYLANGDNQAAQIKVDNVSDDDKDAGDDEDVYEELDVNDPDDEDEVDEDDEMDKGEEDDGEYQINDEKDGIEDESDEEGEDDDDDDEEEEINDDDVDSPLDGHVRKIGDKQDGKNKYSTSSAINAATRTTPGSEKTTVNKQNDQDKASAVGTIRAATQTARKFKKNQKSRIGSRDSGGHQIPANGSKSQSPTEPNISDRPTVRRVLAQRDVAGKTFFLVDSFPSWAVSSSIPRCRIADWNGVADHTFQRGPDKVLKVRNPTSDDEDMLMRQLIENVMRKFGEYIYPHPSPDKEDQVTGRLVRQLFKEDEWTFSNTTANNEHIPHMQRARAELGKTAAQTMQAAFVEALRHKYSKSQDRLTLYYGDVHVQYKGNVPTKTTKYTKGFNGHTVSSLIAPFFAGMLWELNPKNTGGEHFEPLQKPVPQYLASLKSQVGYLLSHCHYLLAFPWPLAFISLFYWNDEVKKQIDSNSPFIFELLDEANETGDLLDRIAYTIIDDCEEERCMDEVWQTFFTAQTYIQKQADAARSASEIAKDDAEKGAKSSAQSAAKGNARRRGGGKDSNKGSNNGRIAPAATKAKGKDDDKPKRKNVAARPARK
ncbi:hypothetical protein E8E13_006471 [Curvularia kusanoi]|uniref:Uncharacterized protein n=1 Tax=Curvularia kusanoi TaxID=90978 RepID=A0A9P4TBB6_CURKU|nr:hypothetical protein E8E13_006471 [Curvularia kusanoi]